jgi:hypothetical protein
LLVLQRQVGRPVFTDVDRPVLAGLLQHLPGERLRRFLLLVRPTRRDAPRVPPCQLTRPDD